MQRKSVVMGGRERESAGMHGGGCSGGVCEGVEAAGAPPPPPPPRMKEMKEMLNACQSTSDLRAVVRRFFGCEDDRGGGARGDEVIGISKNNLALVDATR